MIFNNRTFPTTQSTCWASNAQGINRGEAMATSRKSLHVAGVCILLLAGCGHPEAEMNNVAAIETVAATNAADGDASSNTSTDAAGDPIENGAAALKDMGSNMTADVPPASPTPYYSSREGEKYYYVSKVSENDKKAGIGVGSVSIFRFLGHHGSKYELADIEDNGTVNHIDTCSNPCTIIRETAPNGGHAELTPFEQGTIIGAAFSDAINGFMRPSKLRAADTQSESVSPSRE